MRDNFSCRAPRAPELYTLLRRSFLFSRTKREDATGKAVVGENRPMAGRAGGPNDLILGVSGASGSRLALRALQVFSASPGVERLHVVVSPRALVVAKDEVDAGIASVEAFVAAAGLDAATRAKLVLHPESAIDASISSGSYLTRGMAVLPCSAGTLASIAHGTSRGLLQRAADVCLKERRRLVLGLRETPLSLVHAENIVAATRAGAIVAPPVPAFYAARTAEAMLDAYLTRVADLLDVTIETAGFRWTGAR
jgi:4-hydroxy-3-polyprenylbenzoate decarboxylase